MNPSRPCSAPLVHPVRVACAIVAAALSLALVGCAPPAGGHRSPLAACDGGTCTDAASSPPPCSGESCGAPPPVTHDGPYLCAPGVMCEAWQDCLDGVCTGEPPPPTGGCLADAECATAESCVEGTCVPASGGDGCASDADCPSDEHCVEGRCGGTPTTTAGCTSDADCTGGMTCVAGTCTTPSSGGGGGCFEDEHCH